MEEEPMCAGLQKPGERIQRSRYGNSGAPFDVRALSCPLQLKHERARANARNLSKSQMFNHAPEAQFLRDLNLLEHPLRREKRGSV